MHMASTAAVDQRISIAVRVFAAGRARSEEKGPLVGCGFVRSLGVQLLQVCFASCSQESDVDVTFLTSPRLEANCLSFEEDRAPRLARGSEQRERRGSNDLGPV